MHRMKRLTIAHQNVVPRLDLDAVMERVSIMRLDVMENSIVRFYFHQMLNCKKNTSKFDI